MKKIAVTVAVLALGLAACTKNDADNAAVNETAVENAADADVNAATTSADNALDATGNGVEATVDATGNAVGNAADAVEDSARNATN
ncbi:MAG: hypothetical protein H0W71_02750 [Sphingomonas sp.]|nr:hypothetical protein [Sphingomonas sp.]